MSSDVTHKQQTTLLQSGSAENDADYLMEDLFSEIDEIVESISQLPNEPILPEYISLGSTIVRSTNASIDSRQLGRIQESFRRTKGENYQYFDKKATHHKKQENFAYYLDLVLFIIAFICVGSVSWWLVSQEKINLNYFVQFFPRSVSSDAQFIDYMLRSLEAIDRKNASINGDNTNRSAISLAPAANSIDSTSPIDRVQKVIERIYIPVYPPTQIPNLPSPREVSPILPTKMALPPPPPITLPKANRSTTSIKPLKIAPSPPKISAPILPPPPPPPTQYGRVDRAPTPPSLPTAPSAPSAPSVSTNQTLRGLLENGDRSAALFDFNGNSETIRIGETIGSSGWTLISISNQKALIRRNGEEIYLSVGQNF
jgi:hypothetical protein